MKTKGTLTGLLILLALTFVIPFSTLGQVKGKGKVKPPVWAPAHGFKAKTHYVYFPDLNFYYDIKKNVYIYQNGKKWSESAKLPSKYANVEMKRAAKVEIERDEDKPQKYNDEDIEKYKDRSKWVY